MILQDFHTHQFEAEVPPHNVPWTSQVVYHGRTQLRDPETQYTRCMVVERK